METKLDKKKEKGLVRPTTPGVKNETAINFCLVANELPTLESDTMFLTFRCKVESLSIFIQRFFFVLVSFSCFFLAFSLFWRGGGGERGSIVEKSGEFNEEKKICERQSNEGKCPVLKSSRRRKWNSLLCSLPREHFGVFGIWHTFLRPHEKNRSKTRREYRYFFSAVIPWLLCLPPLSPFHRNAILQCFQTAHFK